ncbi:phage holin family protein [Pantoea agglomerans]|nr:phage holin family protein [Pantoea agglomerans]
MTDPLSVTGTSAVISGLSGSAWLAFFYGVPPEVVLGAFSGSVIFVTAAQEYPIKRRLILALISFIAGGDCFPPGCSPVNCHHLTVG